MRKLALLFALLCVFPTACIQDAEPGEASISNPDDAESKMASEPAEPPPTDDVPTELITKAEHVGEVRQPLPAKYCGDQLAACVAGCAWQEDIVLCHAICILAYQGCLRL